MIKKVLTGKNVIDKKHKLIAGLEGVWRDVLGKPEASGVWVIMGNEKHGKTTLALLLAEALTCEGKVLYVSGEEGIGAAFKNTLIRLNIGSNPRVNYLGYEPLEELSVYLKKRWSPRIVIIDNIMHYSDELKYGGFRRLCSSIPNTLFIFLGHMSRGDIDGAVGKMIKRYASAVFHTQGLAAFVSGRVPGGSIVIDEEKAAIYHGQSILNND